MHALLGTSAGDPAEHLHSTDHEEPANTSTAQRLVLPVAARVILIFTFRIFCLPAGKDHQNHFFNIK